MADLTGPESRVLGAVDEGWAVDGLSRLLAIASVDGTDAGSRAFALLAVRACGVR